MEVSLNKNKIFLEIDKNEAIVLLEFVSRVSKSLNVFEDDSEKKNFSDLECLLEKTCDNIFATNYKEILKESRLSIKNST